jgi:hypothetical protein
MAAILDGQDSPSFTIILAAEIAEGKPFRNALDKKERNLMMRLMYLHPIVMSILFHHYK